MKKLRAWVTPITIGSFLLIGITGLLMFFKVRGGLIVGAHEWLSPIFAIGLCLHVWLNWAAVRANLSRARGIIIVGLFGALLALAVAPLDEMDEVTLEHGHGQQEVGRKAAEALLQARVSAVAELAGCTPQELRDRLDRYGIRVSSGDVSLADAAHQSQVSPVRALHAALQRD